MISCQYVPKPTDLFNYIEEFYNSAQDLAFSHLLPLSVVDIFNSCRLHAYPKTNGWIGTGSRQFSGGGKRANSGPSILPWEVHSIQNPIHKVLSTLSAHKVRALLIGGQACVFYGAAEFSRDTDLTLLASDDNLALLRGALRDLRARRIAVPPFERHFLLRGHAIHFRCYHPDALKMRIDIMAVMRGVDQFALLWDRRTHLVDEDGQHYEVISLQDLIRSKKTQRDKDWPMIRRLVEADYVTREVPSEKDMEFWQRESRTPAMLIELARSNPKQAKALIPERPLLSAALSESEREIEEGLEQEERREREADRAYWEPLRRELEALRHGGEPSEEEV
jgi:hypothetical protein